MLAVLGAALALPALALPALALPAAAGAAAAGAAAAGAAAAGAADAPGGDERIVSYDVAIDVRPDGSLRVSEEIRYDFGALDRHGIIRDVVNTQRYDGSRDRVYPVRDIEVGSSSGAPARFEVTESGGEVHVKVGDPDLTVTGRQDYRIGYTVLAATTALPDRDELYWNAFGPKWTVPVDQVSVTVTAPVRVGHVVCYAGPVGSRAPCATAIALGSEARYRAGPLPAGEAVTVGTVFPAGTVATAAPVLRVRLTPRRFLLREPWYAGVGVGLLALAAVPVARRRRRYGAERAALAASAPRVGLPETSPPDGIPPALAGVLLAERPRRPHVVATLADLAERGYLGIEQRGRREWRLYVLRGPDADLAPWELTLLQGLFKDSPDVLLSQLRSRLGSVVRQVEGALAADATARGWLRVRVGTGRVPLAVLGALALLLGVPLLIVLGLTVGAGALGIAVLVAGVLLIVAALYGPPRLTGSGTAMRARVLGFRRWLGTLDPARVPPEAQDAAFRRLLPYAVALGLAPALVQAFGTVLAAGGSGSLWYSQVGHFTSDVTRAGSPSSSGGGGGSSFSGSSGGGGGGGGGGSW